MVLSFSSTLLFFRSLIIMFFSPSFAALLKLAVLPAVLSATIAGVSEITAVSAESFTYRGQEIRVATVPIASSLTSSINNATHSSSLSKRVTTS